MDLISIRENGLVANLFKKERPSTAVIVLGGSSGGFQDERAERLARAGFAGVSLAYFAAENLPPTLKQIPLEYFEEAIQRVKSEPGIEKIALWGISRGAELALILGTLFPKDIHAIAAHVPSSVSYGALAEDPAIPAWTYRGKALLPPAPFPKIKSYDPSIGLTPETAISATSSFLNSMKDSNSFRAASIPVEKIRCPLLLISAEDDQMWPSTLFAKQIMERLQTHRSPILCKHLSYPQVGHSPNKGSYGLHPIMKRWFAFGGDAAKNVFATEDWMRQTIAFFEEVL